MLRFGEVGGVEGVDCPWNKIQIQLLKKHEISTGKIPRNFNRQSRFAKPLHSPLKNKNTPSVTHFSGAWRILVSCGALLFCISASSLLHLVDAG